MPSSIPGFYEGAPFHDDDFMLSFNGAADSNSVSPFIGALVTLNGSGTGSFDAVIGTSATAFILGVCQTSGQLGAAINVIVRGVVTVTTDSNLTEGMYLTFSTTVGHDGYVSETASSGTTASRLIALQTVNGSVSPAPVLALLF